jgi:hypothetical protein
MFPTRMDRKIEEVRRRKGEEGQKKTRKKS